MKLGLLCVLFSFISLSVGSALNESLTYDEVFYLEEGRGILSGGQMRDPYNPPLMPILAGLPTAIGWETWVRSPTPAHQAFFSRMVVVALGSMLILSVYIVGSRIFSRNAGLIASFLLAFHPSLLAHSHYVTSDTGVTLFVFLAVVYWLKFLARPTVSGILLFAGAAGYAVGMKVTSLGFIPAMVLISVWQKKGLRSWSFIAKHRGKMIAGCMSFFLLLWAVFLFRSDVVIRPRPDATRVSSRLMQTARDGNMPWLATSLEWLQTRPIPLGGMLAIVKNNAIRSLTLGNERPSWHQLLVTIGAKTPLPLMILFMLGLILMGRQPNVKKRYVTLFVSAILMMIVFSLIGGMAPMIRYVLPVYPFVVLVSASIIHIVRWRGAKILMVLLLLWYAWGSVSAYPHFISYANEFVGPRDRRYEVLADSNLDWGQALPDVARYIRQHQLGTITFSYFGRDDGGPYGLASTTAYGGWKFEDICAFHDVHPYAKDTAKTAIISVSNWYACGYNTKDAYRKEKIRDVVADVFLVF